ncbi:MAG: phosphate ABC transporter substrate-binding protein [Caldisericia bacterium]|nr:phosphate ABC transporter substrate-binding protein [Caldisericia bacterium]
MKKVFKKQQIKELVVAFVVLGVLGLSLIGCVNNKEIIDEGNHDLQKNLSGVIREAGSTSVLPLAEKFALAFMSQNRDVEVAYSGGGSSAGVEQCAIGTIDIGAASREIKITEKDMLSYPIARDGVAIVVNSKNPITDLTIKDVANIYAGNITNWNELGGNDQEITIYSREEGSGTRDCFDSKVLKPQNLENSDTSLMKKSNGEMQIGIQEDASGIGYVSLGYISGLKALSINGKQCSVGSCMDGTYPLVRRLYFITKEAPNTLMKAFIDFCRSSEGQEIAENNGYVPLVK